MARLPAAGLQAQFASRGRPDAVARRILIADQSPVSRLFAQRQLHELGYHAEIVADAAQAIERHQRQLFDLILMDSQMALDQDAEIPARLRASDHVRHVNIIACTTASSEEQRSACLQAGMSDVCVKPLHQPQLRTLLLVWLPPRTVEEASRRDADTRAELRSLADLFGNGFGEVVALFAADTEARLLALHEAATTGDTAQLHRLAHALSGSCASMSGWRMAGLCRVLDQRYRNAPDDGCARLLADIQNEYRSLRLQLEHVLRCQRLTLRHAQ